MDLPDSLYLHAFNLLPQFGPARLELLARRFADYAAAFRAGRAELLNAGLDENLAEQFLDFRQRVDLAAEAGKLKAHDIGILTLNDAAYPRLLKEIPKAPPILYYKGRMDEADELCLAVVGTRQITSYGRTVVPQLAGPLAAAGAVIVSGLAFGVDAAAHEEALKQGRRTIAVLGGGLDEASLYPKHHALLARRILDGGGALLSEYPVGTPNFKQNFVARNRIISGLCAATLVVECDLDSGTLITARHALDQNRQVFAVPGPIYSPQSRGPNNLLKLGAKPATAAADILEDLNLQAWPEQQQTRTELGADTAEEAALLRCLNFEPQPIDQIIKQCGLSAAAAATGLTFLEMKGKIRNLGGQQYALAR